MAFTKKLQVRTTEEEAISLSSEAESRGITLSELLRERVFGNAFPAEDPAAEKTDKPSALVKGVVVRERASKKPHWCGLKGYKP